MSYQLNNLKVLVVEDNMPMLELAKSLLMTFGVVQIFTARSGEEGFQVCCDENPDLIIADWNMKPMDGVTMTEKIRNDVAAPNPFVPVILMTGFSEEKRVVAARDSGVTEFLVKPFNARDLYRRIVEVIEKPRQFVRSEVFFGPDRRRRSDDGFKGEDRRKRAQVVATSDNLKMNKNIDNFKDKKPNDLQKMLDE